MSSTRPPGARRGFFRWRHELLLLLAVAASIGAIGAITWSQGEEDRAATLADGGRIAGSLAQAIENHLDAALRDAGNAALSAALLVEQGGGIQSFGDEARLHRELKRELWDETSTARLLLVDAADRVVASSAEYPVPARIALPRPTHRWQGTTAGGRPFWIGAPQRSALDGAWILPYWCDVLGADGRAVGRVRAELRVDGVLQRYDTLDQLNRAVVLMFSSDGVVLMRHPLRDDLMGTSSSAAVRTLAATADSAGVLLTDATVDKVTRMVAWRRMARQPLVAAVGMDRDDLVVGWGQRTDRRTAVAALACAVIVLLAGTVLVWLRRTVAVRVQADRALRELNEDLERRVRERTDAMARANQDLEAFTYSAAHDLRGPLGRLGAYVDVLCREIGPVAQLPARRVAAIHRQLGVMTALIDKLLAFSRLSRAALCPVPVDLGELVLDLVQDLQEDIGERQVWFCIGLLPRVQADRELLRQAMANLLGNALKYTRGRPVARIEIDACEALVPGEACVSVRDNGAGFDMAFAGDLFAPFKRLHGSAEFEGSGIGLSIVHRVVERHGGRVWARGVPAQGAQFWITLPAA